PRLFLLARLLHFQLVTGTLEDVHLAPGEHPFAEDDAARVAGDRAESEHVPFAELGPRGREQLAKGLLLHPAAELVEVVEGGHQSNLFAVTASQSDGRSEYPPVA